MNSSDIKLAWRNFSRRKGTTVLNMSGLIVGMVSCLLIFQFVSYEKSYDTFQEKASQIYRVRLDQYKEGKLEWQSATNYPATGPTLKKDFKEVLDFCRLVDREDIFSNPQQLATFKETKGYYADPSAVSMLNVTFVDKLNNQPLRSPNQLIISEKLALKYFGKKNVAGKRIRVHTKNATIPDYLITGVFKNYPSNSHLIIDYLVSYETLVSEMKASGDSNNSANTSFSWYDIYTYILIRKGSNVRSFEEKLQAFTDRYINSRADYQATKTVDRFGLIGLSDIHLYSSANQEAEINGNGQLVAFLFMISIFILCIAWINYINLSTAQSTDRAKEVGVKKVLGAQRSILIRQFVLEGLLLNFCSLVISLFIAWLIVPYFNTLFSRENLSTFYIASTYMVIFAILFILGTLSSAVYPAFVLSAYKPVKVLKGIFKSSTVGLSLRKALIIFQFSVSIIMITGTIVIFRQVQFMRKQSLGTNISQTLVLRGPSSIADSLYTDQNEAFRNELEGLSGIRSITASSDIMGQEIYWTRSVKRQEQGSSDVTFYILGIDYHFVPQFDLAISSGRNLSKDHPLDGLGQAVLINESGAKRLGYGRSQEALNQNILFNGRTVTIAGVLKDYHHLGLQKPIEPQLFFYYPNARNSYSIKISSDDIQNNVSKISAIWKEHFPNDPFQYLFLDSFFNQQYRADEQFGNMFTVFSLLAILIASFGLLGLSSFAILQRTKEIGVRKVLGASGKQIVFVLSKDFIFLGIVAMVIAVPVSALAMQSWLQNYAYRIELNWAFFAIGGLFTVMMVMFTTFIQSIKAASKSPAKSLKVE
jgi:putative ABC transport system permease protein